ncbi:Domain of uncharacterised function(DUF2779) [Mesomycoplasma conjunctivae]|uniref:HYPOTHETICAL Uncharacterized protein MG366 n=1 Tax=Mesomycoplasma conjunctivae (strain ATCC 25834 / NCTC 10147 / HRC/581) TaxID=572263 RepID=C5J699_MESCH|nr:DUF2779 domain-containing protein [Mesomycoplasma conjunctivae]CAT04991.1 HYPOTHETICAL Uncharacterized protein MG366 [Mesomycoplasma conjunctivae]VEU66348.1 Domain of uncharacterised function(DUF2779) [Mesomycoplasma conjunctivae]
MDYIKFFHYYRLSTCQPFFVWNNLTTEENEDDDVFWDLDNLEDRNPNFIDLHANIFQKFNNAFLDFIKNKYQNLNICIVKDNVIDKSIKQTQEFIKNGHCDIILWPTFLFEDAIAKPDFYFIKNKEIGHFKVSTSSKIKDFLRSNWDFWITTYALREQTNDFNPIEQVSIFLIKDEQFAKAKTIDFEHLYNISKTKTTKQISAKEKTFDKTIVAKIAKQYGMTFEEFNTPNCVEKNSIYNSVIKNVIEKQACLKGKSDNGIPLIPIKKALIDIRLAKDIKELDLPNDLDNGSFEKNKFFKEIVLLKQPKLANFSGNFLTTSKILQALQEPEIITNWDNQSFWFKFLQQENKIIINKEKNLRDFLDKMNGDKKIVWFDFEAFSLPYPAIDYTSPYQQLVFQVSIITTLNGEIIEQDFDKTNLVFDPINYNWKNCFQIIDSIYSEDADWYIVFNKSYEESKLKEMLKIIEKTIKADFNPDGLEINNKIKAYQDKVNKIISKIIDLKDPFANAMVILSDLKAFYSIKKIEYFITKYNYQLKRLITPYKSLAVQNGLQAMKYGIDRYLNFIGDNEWIMRKKELQIYCQNDVIAMIMVWDFLNFILDNLGKLSNIQVIETKNFNLLAK